MNIIVEGIDRLGKSTLCSHLAKTYGYYYTHLSKPQINDSMLLAAYEGNTAALSKHIQVDLYYKFFTDLKNLVSTQVFDRGHLSESVYAPLYRGYNGDYVFSMEKAWDYSSKIGLILLTTDNFSFLVDDGQSLDFTKKELEQDQFIKAFNKSNLINKVILNVHNGVGSYRSTESLIKELKDKKFF